MKDIQHRPGLEGVSLDLHITSGMCLQDIQVGIEIQGLKFRRKICAKQMDLDPTNLWILETLRVDEITYEEEKKSHMKNPANSSILGVE